MRKYRAKRQLIIGKTELEGQAIGEKRFPQTLYEMRKIFKGESQVIIPEFVTKFPKEYLHEVGGTIRAYPVYVKGKKVIVLAPRLDPNLHYCSMYTPTRLERTSKYNFLFGYRGSDERKARNVREGRLIGSFHTHPPTTKRISGFDWKEETTGSRSNWPSYSDLNVTARDFVPEVFVSPSRVSLVLPFESSASRLKTRTLRFSSGTRKQRFVQEAKVIQVKVKSDKSVWNILKKLKRKGVRPTENAEREWQQAWKNGTW